MENGNYYFETYFLVQRLVVAVCSNTLQLLWRDPKAFPPVISGSALWSPPPVGHAQNISKGRWTTHVSIKCSNHLRWFLLICKLYSLNPSPDDRAPPPSFSPESRQLTEEGHFSCQNLASSKSGTESSYTWGQGRGRTDSWHHKLAFCTWNVFDRPL